MNREIIEKYPDSKIKKVRFIEDESNPRVTTEITYKENGKKDEEVEYHYLENTLQKKVKYRYQTREYHYFIRKTLKTIVTYNNNGHVEEEYMTIGEFDPSPTEESIKDLIHISTSYNKNEEKHGLRICYKYKDGFFHYDDCTRIPNRYKQYIARIEEYSNGKMHGLLLEYIVPTELLPELEKMLGENSSYSVRDGKERCVEKSENDGIEYVLSQKGYFKDGKRDGDWIECYRKSGCLQEKGRWKKGKKHGKWFYAPEKRIGHDIITFNNGTMIDFTNYYNNGIKRLEREKIQQIKTPGSIVSTDDSSTVHHGKFARMHYDLFMMDPGHGNGLIKYYDRKENLLFKGDNKSGNFTFIEDARKNYPIELINFNNDMLIIKENKNDYFDYLSLDKYKWNRKRFYEGVRRSISKKHNVSILFLFKRVFNLVNLKNGLLNGRYLEWNYDQSIIIDGFFTNGKKNGEWKFYGDDGCLSMVINFLNGEKNGFLNKFDKYGQIIEKRDYLNDRQYLDMKKNIIEQNDNFEDLLPDIEYPRE